MDHTFGCTDDEHLVVADVHAVDAIFALDAGYWLVLSKVPVFDHLIPAACDKHLSSVGGECFGAADRLIVCRYLLSLCCASAEIEHPTCLVCATGEDLLAVLYTKLISYLDNILEESRAYSPNSNNNPIPALHDHITLFLAYFHFHLLRISALSCPMMKWRVAPEWVRSAVRIYCLREDC